VNRCHRRAEPGGRVDDTPQVPVRRADPREPGGHHLTILADEHGLGAEVLHDGENTQAELGPKEAKRNWTRGYNAVADYVLGTTVANAFTKGMEQNGGKVIGEVRLPVSNPNFTA